MFKTAFGTGVARWPPNAAEPILGREYDVELNVDAAIEIGRNAKAASSQDYKMAVSGQIVELQGVVESLDPDGMVYLRLAQDCLIMIESESDGIHVGGWLLLSLPPANLEVWPLGEPQPVSHGSPNPE